MFPGGLTPVQGRSLSASGLRSRSLTWLTLAVVGMAGWTMQAPRPAPPDAAYSYCTPSCSSAFDPANVEERIVALCRAGRPADAVALADIHLACGDQNTPLARSVHSLRGGALRLLRREEEARTDYTLAIDWNELPGSAAYDLSSLGEAQKWPELSRRAHEILQKDSQDDCTVNNTCWALLMNPAAAPVEVARLMKPIADRSHEPSYLDTYAWSLYLSGQRDAAIEQEQRAVGKEADDDPYYAACLKGMRGDREAAHAELIRVFQNDIRRTEAWVAASRFVENRGG